MELLLIISDCKYLLSVVPLPFNFMVLFYAKVTYFDVTKSINLVILERDFCV